VEQAAPGPLDITTAFSGTFEIAQTTQNTEALRAAAFPYITGTVILAALAILTRVAFTQSRVRDHIGPVVYLVVAALMLLVAYNILQENRESPTVPADRSEAAG
jgi:uncharacterized membrane protein